MEAYCLYSPRSRQKVFSETQTVGEHKKGDGAAKTRPPDRPCFLRRFSLCALYVPLRWRVRSTIPLPGCDSNRRL